MQYEVVLVTIFSCHVPSVSQKVMRKFVRGDIQRVIQVVLFRGMEDEPDAL